MSAANEITADDNQRSTLFALMEAPNRRRNWRFGRKLQFHGPAWDSLDSGEVATLLQSRAQRPHIRLQDIARMLEDTSRDEASPTGST